MSTITEATNSVQIDGVTYKVRRLSVRDSVALFRIFKKSINSVAPLLGDMGDVSPEFVGTLIITSLPDAEDEIYELFASLIAADPQAFADMPLDAPLLIVEALTQNSDLESFFSTAYRLFKMDGALRGLWNRLSTQYSTAMDGVTTTS